MQFKDKIMKQKQNLIESTKPETRNQRQNPLDLLVICLGKMLHYANRRPPALREQEFYAIKEKILLKHGQKIGYDVQHIRKDCYSCDETGTFRCDWKMPEPCWNCGGTGLYEEFWTLLETYQLGKYTFHKPVSKVYENPGYQTFGKIEGYIRHNTPRYYLSAECAFWLFLIYDRQTFFNYIGKVGFPSRKFTPMVIISTVIQKVRQFRFRDLLPRKDKTYEFEYDDDLPF